MIEWTVAALLFLALVVLACRRGHRHLLGPKLPWVIVVGGALGAWMLEALPFTPYRAAPSYFTMVAIACGALAARLVLRGLVGWARGAERDLAAGMPPPTGIAARAVHPLIGVGFVLFAWPLLFLLVAVRHESLEMLGTPRDPKTGVVLGAEDVRLQATPPARHAVLLVHGFLGSPADFGDLPARLHAAGFDVRALRLPGHGTIPIALDDEKPQTYADAVDAARADLEKTHAKVSVVGLSFGGALAIDSAARRAPYRLVLANPWLGETVRPWWSPVSIDTATALVAPMATRVFRPPGLVHVDDPAGRDRVRTYATLRTKAFVEVRDMARAAGAPAVEAKLTAPTLVLLSTGDRVAVPARTEAWFGALPLPPAAKRLVRLDRGDHVLFLDYDREAATQAVVRFLSE